MCSSIRRWAAAGEAAPQLLVSVTIPERWTEASRSPPEWWCAVSKNEDENVAIYTGRHSSGHVVPHGLACRNADIFDASVVLL